MFLMSLLFVYSHPSLSYKTPRPFAASPSNLHWELSALLHAVAPEVRKRLCSRYQYSVF